MTMVTAYDDRICQLGEGPLWHPMRAQLYWFDILSKRLLTVENGQMHHWQFDEHVSAAGWVDRDTLLIASETALFRFDVTNGARDDVIALEANNPVTRSNDGRADPWGGFWIGTMGKNAEDKAGAIYRYFEGQLERLYSDITISNAICFSPDKTLAYYCDTPTKQIMKQNLDARGWPVGAPAVFVDLKAQSLNPDGAVVDAAGCLWNAQWDAYQVARYSPQGEFMSAITLPAQQVTCPAFGGADFATLFATSAAVDLPHDRAGQGLTFAVDQPVQGLAEYQVCLG
jgi:sugar lactone lactonase YvrE